jgi:hypothetical protein
VFRLISVNLSLPRPSCKLDFRPQSALLQESFVRDGDSTAKWYKCVPIKSARNRIRTEDNVTICVGALAGGGQSLVCVADKAMSYRDYIQWDGDSTKIITLSSSQVVSISGHGPHIDRVVKKLEDTDQLYGNVRSTISSCEKAYQKAREEILELQVLNTRCSTPRLLRRWQLA